MRWHSPSILVVSEGTNNTHWFTTCWLGEHNLKVIRHLDEREKQAVTGNQIQGSGDLSWSWSCWELRITPRTWACNAELWPPCNHHPLQYILCVHAIPTKRVYCMTLWYNYTANVWSWSTVLIVQCIYGVGDRALMVAQKMFSSQNDQKKGFDCYRQWFCHLFIYLTLIS